MAGYNRVVIVGNLTRDPEYKQLASGQAVSRLGLATNRQFKNRQNGSMIQEVCFIDIDVWGAQAESCKQYLQKGRSVLVEGRLKFDTWEDQNGQTRSKHSIVADRVVFLSSAGDANDEDVATQSAAPSNARPSSTYKAAGMPEPESEQERELFDQIDSIKKKNDAKKAAPKKAAGGEIEFKDQAPFEDELPF
jgi:single-strand DNA-binding protein